MALRCELNSLGLDAYLVRPRRFPSTSTTRYPELGRRPGASSAYLVIEKLTRGVRKHVTLAGHVGNFGDSTEGRLVFLTDFGRELFRLLTHSFVCLIPCNMLRLVHVQASSRGRVTSSPGLVDSCRDA